MYTGVDDQREDCVELGLACADVCTALSRGLNGKSLNDLNDSVCEAIKRLTTWVKPMVISSKYFTDDALYPRTLGEIQREIVKKGKRNAISRLFHAKINKETIVAWKSDLGGALLIFNVRSVAVVRLLLTVRSQTELALNTHTIVSGIDRNVASTQTMVSRIDNNIVDTHTMVSDIHHIVVKSQEAVDGKNTSVNTTCTLSITE
jgi:hypothetical protein